MKICPRHRAGRFLGLILAQGLDGDELKGSVTEERMKAKSGSVRLTSVRLALFGLPYLPLSIVFLPVALYIPAFYSTDLGLSLPIVGLILTLANVTDVVTDPLIGIASDRLRTRFGRRKPWIALGTPLMGLSLWMLFVPPESVTWGYLLGWLALLYLSFTLVDIPYRAWGAELSTDYQERSRITAWREGFGILGLIAALAIPLGVAAVLDMPGPRNALYAVAVAVVVALPVFVVLLLVSVPEPPAAEARKETVDFVAGMKLVWRNRPFRRLLVSFGAAAVAISMTASMSFFFVAHVMEQPFERYAIFVLIYYLSSTVSISLWLRISERLGKHKTFVLGTIWLSIWSAPIPLLSPDYFWIFVVIMVLKGSAVGSLYFLPSSMAADVVDLDAVETGESRAGLYFSIWGMVSKGAAALGVLLATSGVAYFGFDPAIESNSGDAKMAVAFFYSLIPASIALIAIPMLWNFPLTRDRHAEIRSRILSS